MTSMIFSLNMHFFPSSIISPLPHYLPFFLSFKKSFFPVLSPTFLPPPPPVPCLPFLCLSFLLILSTLVPLPPYTDILQEPTLAINQIKTLLIKQRKKVGKPGADTASMERLIFRAHTPQCYSLFLYTVY